jgi:hypothetical protein
MIIDDTSIFVWTHDGLTPHEEFAPMVEANYNPTVTSGNLLNKENIRITIRGFLYLLESVRT